MAELQFLPQGNSINISEISVSSEPAATYKLDIERGCIRGMTDGADAMLQTVYLILNTERYSYPIYSRSYGVELSELRGKPKDFVMSEAKRRITEALMQDDRITEVCDWSFESKRNAVSASFTVRTVYGDIESSKEVAL